MSTANSSNTILGAALPNIPWEERPSNHGDVLWRSARNPIIPHDLIPSSQQHLQQRRGALWQRFRGRLPLR